MNKATLSMLIVAVLLLAASVAGAQQMIVELDPLTYDRMTDGTTEEAAADIAVCDLFHEVYPDYCTIWHVIAVFDVVESQQAVRLENARGVAQDFSVDRVAPQYHLDTGAIFEPQGEWNPNDAAGEQWTQLRPLGRSALTVAHWDDANRDGLVSAGDGIVFTNGAIHKLIDVRIGLTLSALPGKR